MTCKRCGTTTPRLTLAQRYCAQCLQDVRLREEQDARRMTAHARFGTVKDLSGWTRGAA